jgi:hypothetical protein
VFVRETQISRDNHLGTKEVGSRSVRVKLTRIGSSTQISELTLIRRGQVNS